MYETPAEKQYSLGHYSRAFYDTPIIVLESPKINFKGTGLLSI